jgi:hypothetical protein
MDILGTVLATGLILLAIELTALVALVFAWMMVGIVLDKR